MRHNKRLRGGWLDVGHVGIVGLSQVVEMDVVRAKSVGRVVEVGRDLVRLSLVLRRVQPGALVSLSRSPESASQNQLRDRPVC